MGVAESNLLAVNSPLSSAGMYRQLTFLANGNGIHIFYAHPWMLLVELQSARALRLRLRLVHVHVSSALANHKEERGGRDENATNAILCVTLCALSSK